MAKCTGVGVAFDWKDGPCRGEPADLQQKAIDNAKKEADKQCDRGDCRGHGHAIGKPVCHEFELHGKMQHIWIASAAYDGECVSA